MIAKGTQKGRLFSASIKRSLWEAFIGLVSDFCNALMIIVLGGFEVLLAVRNEGSVSYALNGENGVILALIIE